MKKEIKKLVRYWQKELRLRDWIVSCEVVTNLEDDEGNTLLGQNVTLLEEKRAVIFIKEPSVVKAESKDNEMAKAHPNAFDVERVVVHELLHLFFEEYNTSSNLVPLEQAINILANKLVTDKYLKEETK